MEGSRQTDIASMYMGVINPVLPFNQHWYIGILLDWILDVFSQLFVDDNFMPQMKKS